MHETKIAHQRRHHLSSDAYTWTQYNTMKQIFPTQIGDRCSAPAGTLSPLSNCPSALTWLHVIMKSFRNQVSIKFDTRNNLK